ncbi:MAG: cyclomaltodextrinase N-terminal domain-containing protein [Paramuribaculum sp.]|nr:cyclomaltodextrinase N-terminal domain-containing protein [Paramuribaculum sp.]
MSAVPAKSRKGRSAPVIDRIDPPHWWVGMTGNTLQLMVCGPEIASARAEISPAYPGVVITERVVLDSSNYLFLYLSISPEAKAGEIPLIFIGKNGKKTSIVYPLLERDPAVKAAGFDSSDVLYLIMPDRFAKGTAKNAGHERDGLEYPSEDDPDDPDARHGGNIAGMADHLYYIESLGVTAVWITPVLKNDMPGGSYHGYATTDYYSIDPRFGSNAEWREFVGLCHQRGIKVVMDMIFNHCGSNHPWMKDMPSRDWVNFPDTFELTNHRLSTIYDPYATDADRKKTVDGWFVREMPDLNQHNPHLMKYLSQSSIWWIEESGIDGIRMDTYPYADMTAMGRWCREIEAEYPGFNIVGECWYSHEGAVAFWQKGSRINPFGDPGLPTVMDFTLMSKARDAFNTPTGPYGQGGLNELYNHLGFDFMMPDPRKILTFLDNHDTDRFLPDAVTTTEQLRSWKQALGFLLTSRGIPQIYYGTELLMSGSKEKSDGNIRLTVPPAQFSHKGRTELQNEAFDYLATLLSWRRSHRRLMREGLLKHYVPMADGVYAYSRYLPDGTDRVVVLLNGTDSEKKIDIKRFTEILTPGEIMRDIISGKSVSLVPGLTLAPRATLILKP